MLGFDRTSKQYNSTKMHRFQILCLNFRRKILTITHTSKHIRRIAFSVIRVYEGWFNDHSQQAGAWFWALTSIAYLTTGTSRLNTAYGKLQSFQNVYLDAIKLSLEKFKKFWSPPKLYVSKHTIEKCSKTNLKQVKSVKGPSKWKNSLFKSI